MLLIKGEYMIDLKNPIQIDAYKKAGYEEAEIVEGKKPEDEETEEPETTDEAEPEEKPAKVNRSNRK